MCCACLSSESGKMTIRLPRLIPTLCLSIVLISSGTAWALRSCLIDGEAVEHAQSFNDEVPSRSGAIEHQHKPASKVHCPEYTLLKQLLFGPVSSIFRLEPPDRDTDARTTPSTITTGGEFFDLTVRRSIKPHLSPHLFLSKLRI